MSIYQHFREEERAFIDLVLEWKEDVLNQYSPKLTDFLDPREQQIVSAIIGTEGEVLVSFDGGSEQGERKRALLYPDYYEARDEEDFQLSYYELNYPSKFVNVEHPQVLGALMSLGLKRSKFGDILVQDERIQLVIADEISSYVEANFTSVGKAKISLVKKERTELLQIQSEFQEKTYTVSSMRLDVLLSTIYNLSRQKVQPFIGNGAVKVNFKTVEQPSFECKAEDVLSLRGFGRSKVISIEGKTKKDKWRVVVGKQQ